MSTANTNAALEPIIEARKLEKFYPQPGGGRVQIIAATDFANAGLGRAISGASDAGRFDVLLAATLLMATIVVLINRFLWRRLYRLASSRFKLET